MSHLIAWLRTLVFYPVYVLILLVQSFLTLLFALFVSPDRLYRLTWPASYAVVSWARWCCGIRYEVIGREHIPATPCVVLSKHQSVWETFFLQTLFVPSSTVLKKELLYIPFVGWTMDLMQPIAIDRKLRQQALREVVRQGIERLASGRHVLVFPEGTRTLPGQKIPYSAGGAMLAVRAGVPVLPVALDSGKCWPRNTWLKRPGVIRVVIGEPVPTAGGQAKVLNEEAGRWIEANSRSVQ